MDKLKGREFEIFKDRDKKLESVREIKKYKSKYQIAA
jgi:hypothetical protein